MAMRRLRSCRHSSELDSYALMPEWSWRWRRGPYVDMDGDLSSVRRSTIGRSDTILPIPATLLQNHRNLIAGVVILSTDACPS
jgi:hypothetical protein